MLDARSNFGSIRSLTSLVAVCGVLCGCATLPSQAAQRGLYVDLRSEVELSQDAGWVADREELAAGAKQALRSLCQAEPAQRDRLDAWLSDQIAREGGSPECVYREHGEDLGAASRVLVLTRTRTLLRYANGRAASDCPFWLAPRADFQGVRGAAGRFGLLIESQASGALVLQSGAAFGFGASVRVLVGHGLGERVTLAIGGELGGAGAFLKHDQARRQLETTLTTAIPMLLRVTEFSRMFDFEVAPVIGLLSTGSPPLPGVRFTVGAGTAMRSFPGVQYGVLWLGYEYHPAGNGWSGSHSVQLGTRIGVN